MSGSRVALLLLLSCAIGAFADEGTNAAEEEAVSDVVVLGDSNFEHLTQVSTGATTGDWFVEFYAPWCGFCKRLTPTWEKLATELKGEVNVAKVDVTENGALGKRFGVKGFPTLVMFSHGQMVEYSGDRSLEYLAAFARGGFKEKDTEPVPAPPTFVEQALREIDGTAQSLFKSLGFWPFFGVAAGIAAAGGFLFGVAVMLFGDSSSPGPSKEKTQ